MPGLGAPGDIPKSQLSKYVSFMKYHQYVGYIVIMVSQSSFRLQ